MIEMANPMIFIGHLIFYIRLPMFERGFPIIEIDYRIIYIGYPMFEIRNLMFEIRNLMIEIGYRIIYIENPMFLIGFYFPNKSKLNKLNLVPSKSFFHTFVNNKKNFIF